MDQELESGQPSAYLNHPNNITLEAARLIWAEATDASHCIDKVARPAGWVLPGGERTTDSGRALQVAAAMNTFFKR